MRILIFGTGVIGSIYGSLLAEAGHAVTGLVRPGRRARYERGVRLRLLDGRRKPYRERDTRFQPPIVEALAPDDGYDLIIVCVKQYQMAEALPVLARGAGRSPVVFLNNNWDGPASIDAVLPRSRYCLGLGASGGFMDGDMVVDGAIARDVRLGHPDGLDAPVLRQARDLFASLGLNVLVIDDIVHWYWVHHAFNAAMIAAAMEARGFAQLLGSNALLRRGVLAARDAMDVVRARGCDPMKFPDARPAYLPVLLAPWILRFALRDAITRKVAESHGQDSAELVHIYDDVIAAADRHGVAAPHLRAFGPAVDVLRRGRPDRAGRSTRD